MTNKNKMGLFSIILLGFNGIIGSGIFLLPNKVMAQVGPAAVLVTLFDALLVISIAVCFAEVGGMFKKNGGPYVYAKEAFGEFVGFAEALMGLLPKGTFANENIAKAIIVTIIVVLLTLVNLSGIKTSKILNNIVTTGKLLPLIIFIAVGLFFINGSNFTPFFVPGKNASGQAMSTGAAIGAAALTIFYAFTGFESIAVAAEDMDNPEKDVPKAILLVIFICSIFYVLIIGIAIGILGTDLVTAKAPIQEAFQRIIGNTGKYLVGAGTLVSIGGINLAASIMTPRSGSALADDGLIPRVIAKKNSKDVPYIAIIITGVLTLALGLYGSLIGSFAILAAISVVSRFVQYVPTCLSVIVLRKKRPDLKPSFRVPFGPVIPILAVVVSFWLLYNSDMQKIVIGLGGLVIGAVVYFLMKLLNKENS